MYDLTSSLFWYKIIFAIELLVAEALIGMIMQKRSKFLLRFLGVAIVVCGLAFALPVPVYSSAYTSALFSIIFIATIFLLKLCYDETWKKILFCGIFAYTAQHIASTMGSYIACMLNMGGFSIYQSQPIFTISMASVIISIGIYMLFYAGIWVFCIYVKDKLTGFNVDRIVLICLAGVLLLVNVILNAVVIYEFTDEFPKTLLTVYFLYDMFCGILIVGMLIFAMQNNKLKSELSILQLLWEKDKENYRIKKEKMEFVTIMAHDIKHRLNAWHSDNESESIKSMENAIAIYDNVYKTGNDVLDIILSENGLYCQEQNLKLICVVDGAILNGISEEDLYSIFDNALHNAIEAAEKVEDTEKRTVKLSVKEVKGIIFIRIENYFEGEPPEFKDGLPVTTHRDKLMHGYGMKSIRMIVQRLGGELKIKAENGLFSLVLYIPNSKN